MIPSKPLQKMRRLNQDLIILGVILPIVALATGAIIKSSFKFDWIQGFWVMIGIGLFCAGIVTHPTRLSDRYDAFLSWMTREPEETSVALRKRKVKPLILTCIAVILWQGVFSLSSAQLNKKYRDNQTKKN